MLKIIARLTFLLALSAIISAGCTKKVIQEDCCTSEYEITTQNYVLPKDFKLFIPQAFTPNGDGVNEQFRPIGQGWTVESMVIKKGRKVVYDFSEHLDPFWTGSDANDGKYSYEITFRVKANKDLFDVKGEVCLFRYGSKGEELPEIELDKVCECIMPDMIHDTAGVIYETVECPVKPIEDADTTGA
ncbi:MAG: hypothetical protein R2813_06680 [Flavobacteriales bacterium]